MTVKPEDLVEVWHLITGNGDEPVEWLIDRSLWTEVQACIDACTIDAGDRLTADSPRTLLGTPVSLAEAPPRLLYHTLGETRTATIVGSADEAQ